MAMPSVLRRRLADGNENTDIVLSRKFVRAAKLQRGIKKIKKKKNSERNPRTCRVDLDITISELLRRSAITHTVNLYNCWAITKSTNCFETTAKQVGLETLIL